MIEMLVGAAIALLGLLAMSQAFMLFDLQRRISGGGMDAQTGAGAALYGIDREARQAGLGFGDQRFAGCPLAFSAGGTPAPLAAVRIVEGDNGAPDSLVLLAAHGAHVPAMPLVAGLSPGAGDITLASTLGMAAGDMLLLREAGKPCSLVRIGAIVSEQHASRVALDGTALSSASETVPAGGYSTSALAVGLGQLSEVAYSVGDAGLMRSVSVPGAAAAGMPIAAEIVSMKAQYGFDTRPGARADLRVDRWSAAMIDADGDGIVGGAGDVQRIAALRLALVARSTARTRRGACVADDAPQWEAADASGVLGRQPISLAHLPDWQCYRYRVVETVIPLRNLIWGML
jgi:type IV pilus assembly protein PilW